MKVALHKFCNYVSVVFGGVDVVQVEGVGRACQGLECGNLKLKKHVVDGVLKFAHLDDLDADIFPCAFVLTFMHCAAVPLPDVLIDLVGIPFDGFNHLLEKLLSNNFLNILTGLLVS
jgi:hypothetical protein